MDAAIVARRQITLSDGNPPRACSLGHRRDRRVEGSELGSASNSC